MSKQEFQGIEYMNTELNEDGSIMFGSIGEYYINNVRFCPWCGKEICISEWEEFLKSKK